MFHGRLIHFGIMQMACLDKFVVQKRGTLL